MPAIVSTNQTAPTVKAPTQHSVRSAQSGCWKRELSIGVVILNIMILKLMRRSVLLLQRTWMSLQTMKFKYEQRKPSDIAEVQASCKKFDSKRHSAVQNDDDNGSSTAKRCRCVDVSHTGFTLTSPLVPLVLFTCLCLLMRSALVISVNLVNKLLTPIATFTKVVQQQNKQVCIFAYQCCRLQLGSLYCCLHDIVICVTRCVHHSAPLFLQPLANDADHLLLVRTIRQELIFFFP